MFCSYLHFSSTELCRVLASSIPAGLFYLSQQLLRTRNGNDALVGYKCVTINFIIRKFQRIISNTLVEVKLTKQDLMPKTMEPLISNWFKRR